MENIWVLSHGAWWVRRIDVFRMVLPDDLHFFNGLRLSLEQG
jgi:hypothetical protein